MSWLYERFSVRSDAEGTIVAQRVFGQWKVLTQTTVQTSPYTNAMWADAFDKIDTPKDARILILGLGGGGAVRQAHERFPHCTVTAVEYDSAMITVAKRLALWSPYPAPDILHTNAKEALGQLGGRFDLILVDLFDSAGISPLLTSDAFLSDLAGRLAPAGTVLVNAAGFTDALYPLAEKFPRSTTWHFRSNQLGAFGF